MPSILDYLNTISDARYGRDVRQAIVDAISACYQDGRAGVSDLEARRLIESAIGVNESQQADIDTLYAQIAEIQGGGGESSQESTTITLDTVIYDGGFVDSVTVNNNATKTYDVTFTQTFTEVPEVFACVAVQNSAAASYSKVTVGIVKAQTTKTGFRFFIANTSGATRSTTVVWAAFQPTTKEIDLDITIPSGDGMSEADVLAITTPIQTSLNGIKTGYDGTVYSTPGEAVREQINDLHVLIGDEPGTAISGSSVAYDGTDSGLSATDMQSAVDEVADALSSTNERLDTLADDASELRDAIGKEVVELIGDYSEAYWNSQGTTAVLTSIGNTYLAYAPIEVTPGNTYHVVAYQGTSNKQNTLLFVNENYLILERLGERASGFLDSDVTAPTGAKYALITVGSRTITARSNTTFTITKAKNRSNLLKGKRVAIIGDSISTNGTYYPTYENTNAVEIKIEEEDIGETLSAYLTHWDVNTNQLTLGGHTFTQEEVGTEVTFTPTSDDVGKVIGLPYNYNSPTVMTWWEYVMTQMDFEPIPVCWSGASITSHEAELNTMKTAHAWHDAQIRKCGTRIPGTMDRIPPDVIIIYRGTNDFSHSPVTKLTSGYFENLQWVYPSTDVVDDGFGYKEGYSLLIKKLRQAYPNAVIYCCTLNVFKRNNADNFPTRNNLYTLPQFNNAIREVANFFGCNIIDFEKDGITFENCYSGGYIVDSETTPTHPSNKGHAVMGKRAMLDIEKTYVPL